MSAGLQLEIVRILASGGFGTVAVVRDRRSGNTYAAKVIRPEHLTNEKVLSRMRDEAALLTRMDHPAIVRVHGLILIADRPVVLMEWIRGAPLHDVLGAIGAGLPVGDAVEIVAATADALAWAWDAPDPVTSAPLRVIHRDLKPSNLLLTVDGRVKVVDFGIARGHFAGKESVTNSMVLGTRDYVSPERLDGDDDQPAGDVYALGMVLYELIAGGRLSQSMLAQQHEGRLQRQIARLAPRGVDPVVFSEVQEIIGAMCAYAAANRPSHAEAAERLRAWIASSGNEPDLARIGERVVGPLVDVPHSDPHRHPDYLELCFLEDPAGVAPSEVDDKVRELLRSPGWSGRREQIGRMLANDPTWTAEPFGEVLEERNPPWWRFWGARLEAEELVALLELAEPRADAVVLKHARALAQHPDPKVAAAAGRVVGRFGAS